jgi:formylglycine-generating enzyme required for sulfatase activity
MPIARLGDLVAAAIEVFSPLYGRDPAAIETRSLAPRPGEKSYEELMTEDESRRAVDLGEMLAVLPAIDTGRSMVDAYGEAPPAPVGAYPAGASPLGVHQLIGDVWEWTSSDFAGYPGFAAWPYREYSEVFFGPEYKVLRGGSFAADRVACRGTFRNWDYPIRRQIFSGFRCARDAAPGKG